MGFEYRDNRLYCDGVDLECIAASAGTPCYVYSAQSITDRYRAYDKAFGDLPHTICYAVKANSNLAILKLLADLGAGFDIVSGGELFRVLEAGGDPRKVVFSGVGKTAEEVDYALESGIFSFNCESEPELKMIDSIAGRRGAKARISLRVNPDVDASTHPYISTGLRQHKFGIDISEVADVYERARALPNLALESVSCHIGSQLLDTRPMIEAIGKVVALVEQLRGKGLRIQHIDLGGGLGIRYKKGELAPEIAVFIEALTQQVRGRDLQVMVEPGRSIVGEAGVLLTRVLYRKRNGEKEFVIVDAGMNDLIRPALYQSHHDIVPLSRERREEIVADVVGPVCESGDFFARNRAMPDVESGELVAIRAAGAYGFVLASNYNSRPRAAEVLVTGDQWRVVRRRETFQDLVAAEVS
jgi:diaminopimelate decarboxylase